MFSEALLLIHKKHDFYKSHEGFSFSLFIFPFQILSLSKYPLLYITLIKSINVLEKIQPFSIFYLFILFFQLKFYSK